MESHSRNCDKGPESQHSSDRGVGWESRLGCVRPDIGFFQLSCAPRGCGFDSSALSLRLPEGPVSLSSS